MMNSNIVNASINAGGNAIVGNENTIIQNFINGLDILLNEYKEQLTNISNLINEFKPKTALSLLEELENRIKDKEILQKELLTSKILYLKGLCKYEIDTFKKEDSARDFVKAYNVNKNDDTFRNRACIEYLNLQEKEKSDSLADEILKNDEFNVSGWFVKCVLSDDLIETLNCVPKILIQNNDFVCSLIFSIIRKEGFDSFDDLQQYNIEYRFDIEEFKELTFANKLKWIINIELQMNKFFAEFPLRYISGDKLIVENNPSLKNALQLLEKYVSTLDKTELSDSITPYKFYYHYLKYLIKNEEIDYKALFENYNDLKEIHWTFAVCVCQVLNHNKKFDDSLIVLNEYKDKGGEITPEYYIFKAVVSDTLERDDEIEEMFMQYLSLKDSLDERTVLNIFYTFFNIQKKYADSNLFKREYDELQKKLYDFPELKELVEVTLKINFFDDKGEDVKQQLREIKIDNFSLIGCKTLIARNFEGLGLKREAISCLETFVDKGKISDELHLYIHFLIMQLYDKNDDGRKHEELLQLLKFWRENSDYIDEQFLIVEHNLFFDINDLDNLEIIDSLLHKHFPENEQYQFFLLLTLDKKRDSDKINAFSETLKTCFENEILGVNIAMLLLKNQTNKPKAFSILFNLAQNKSNTNARRAYFTHSAIFTEFLEKFDEANIGNWVVYSIDKVTDKVKIIKSEGLQGKFIGKKVGDTFIEISKMSGVNNNIEVLEIYNDAMNLFREITEEAHNPINELGFESMKIPEKIEDFEEFLKNLLGAQGTEHKKYIDESLNEYYNCAKGFIEITKAVFKEDFIDAYNHLTLNLGAKYTTIPSALTNNDAVEDYGLDFSTLLLFYNLETDFGFEFIHKFKISFQVKSAIEQKIQELKVSPVSTLSVNITLERVEKFIYPENINEIRIEYLEKVLLWINNNCVIDNVTEKLELYPKLKENEKNFDSDFTKMLVDLMYMSSRQDFRLISSDSFIFINNFKININNNILNPEKYLKTYYPEKCDEIFYRQLLKWNYIGIDISFGVLKNEFVDFLAGKENYYSKAVENLQFSLHSNQNIIYTCSKFLKEIYLVSSITIENKNRYAFDVIASSFNQIPLKLIPIYEMLIKSEFKLLGDYYDEALKVFGEIKKLYGIK